MISIAILTISDSAAAGTREDLSGPAIRARCEQIGWTVATQAVVPDEETAITNQLRDWVGNSTVALILTTGGTGVSARDITPEATRRVIEREIPGLPELMRMEGLKTTKFASLSRAVAGVCGATLIINLPGSPKGSVESLTAIQDIVPHAIDLLQGRTNH